MATKTITIMDDAYNLLINSKLEDESFSEEIRRILSKKRKKSLKDYFGILDKETGDAMLKDLKEIRSMNIKLLRKKINENT